jgi:hypothetical protein
MSLAKARGPHGCELAIHNSGHLVHGRPGWVHTLEHEGIICRGIAWAYGMMGGVITSPTIITAAATIASINFALDICCIPHRPDAPYISSLV